MAILNTSGAFDRFVRSPLFDLTTIYEIARFTDCRALLLHQAAVNTLAACGRFSLCLEKQPFF